MATQTPIPSNIKSAARKLPIKRKTSSEPQPQTHSSTLPLSDPNPNPNPNFAYADSSASASALVTYGGGGGAGGEEDYDFGCDDDDDGGGGSEDLLHDPNPKPPPFKFHRIWSESDEIRFLQGLLGCYSQGLVFPRDLNLFYDRFSESMPQPYTRSQLSEKLRRLRKKYRIMSNRIARGQDPNRLAPHDRDLLHLCTRLWHSDHASTSPFAAPEASASKGNKRRRPNPRSIPAMMLPQPAPPVSDPGGSAIIAFDNDYQEPRSEEEAMAPGLPPVVPAPASSEAVAGIGTASNDGKETEKTMKYVTLKTVLDVLDGSLEEVRSETGKGVGGDELARRWREQRVAELDVFARRLRLVLEQSLLG